MGMKPESEAIRLLGGTDLSIIHKLEINAKVLLLKKCDDGLKLVFAFTLNPDMVAVNLSLGFKLVFLHPFHDGLGFFINDAALNGD